MKKVKLLREPNVLKRIGELSRKNGTDQLSSDDIDRIIQEARAIRKLRAEGKKS